MGLAHTTTPHTIIRLKSIKEISTGEEKGKNTSTSQRLKFKDVNKTRLSINNMTSIDVP